MATLSKEQGITAAAVMASYDLFVCCGLDAADLLPGRRQQPRPPCPSDETSAANANANANAGAGTGTGNGDGDGDGMGKAASDGDGANADAGARARPDSGTEMDAGAGPSGGEGGGGGISVPWSGVLRVAVLGAGTLAILVLRLRMNTLDIKVDQKTNPANHIADPTLRRLTKCLYASLHAWLLLFPKTLCCDWSAGAIETIESVEDPRNFGSAALLLALLGALHTALLSQQGQRFKAELFVGLVLLVAPFLPASGLFMDVGFVLAERIL